MRRQCALPDCRAWFRPFHRDQEHCSKRCGAIAVMRRQMAEGEVTPRLKGALAVRQLLARRRAEADIGEAFGDLSDREIQLFNRGVQIGYRRGYQRIYHRVRKAATP